MPLDSVLTRRLAFAGIGLLVSAIAAAQTGIAPPPALLAGPPRAPGYDLPSAEIQAVMRAPSPPVPSLSPTRDRLLLVSWQDYPAMARVAAPYLKLAGARVEPRNHSKRDTPGGYGIAPCVAGLQMVSVDSGAVTPIALPAGACPEWPQWTADGKRFAFANIAADSVELWVGDAASGMVRKLPGIRLNPMLGSAWQWLPDQASLLVKLVPADLGAAPVAAAGPSGPSIQESGGGKGQSSTYETRDTLGNAHDEDVFDYYAKSQLAMVDAASGAITSIGNAGLYERLEPAPDGRHVLVTALHKPYSYVTTYERFPHEVAVWQVDAGVVKAVRPIASIPLADRVPIAGVRLGPREFDWRPTEPATLVWAEALDGGDWATKAAERDRLMISKAPFSEPPREWLRLAQRYSGLDWSERPEVALLEEYDENRHWRKTFVVDADHPENKPRLLFDLSTDERYKNPGNPVLRRLGNGAVVVRMSGDAIFLAGIGSSPDGDRPFLDRLDLATQKSQRLFRSDRDAYERFLGFAGAGEQRFLTSRQSVVEPPNVVLRTLGAPADAGRGEAAFASTRAAVTHIVDPTPAVRAIEKRLVTYKRADGVDLSFTLYTPPGYKPGTRVPTILNAYPLDYANAATAGQVSGSQATFTTLRQYRLLLLAGYAIIDRAAFPVVGDPKKAYDSYLEQLVADAKAAVDEAVRLGVADPERIGVTGHSHGALMTVNLIAHSNLFRAGVATSGSYNKTLTPFGFQSERRSVWEAPDVYQKVSPFFVADKIKTPLLIVHGTDDANPGTTPLQATKLYEAVRGNGGTTRLVMLPNEPHWYAAMESNEQLVFEMQRWFDRYVKNAPPRGPLAAR